MTFSFLNEAHRFDPKSNCVELSRYDGTLENIPQANKVLSCEKSHRNASTGDYLIFFRPPDHDQS